MVDWLKRLSATAAGRIIAWAIISAATTTGLGLSLAASWDFVREAPLPIKILTGLGVAFPCVTLAFLIWLYLNLPIASGVYGSKYLLWYMLPIRRISWDFRQLIGGNCGQGSPVIINSFQFRLKKNWGPAIRPTQAYIYCETTGLTKNALLEVGNEYAAAKTIKLLPKKQWVIGHVPFGEITREQLFQLVDGFDFVFEHDGTSFRRRFERAELEMALERFWRYSNGKLKAKGVLREE